jgi:hypothetical protein
VHTSSQRTHSNKGLHAVHAGEDKAQRTTRYNFRPRLTLYMLRSTSRALLTPSNASTWCSE